MMEEMKVSRRVEWWQNMMYPVRRVWFGVATRLRIRKNDSYYMITTTRRKKWPPATQIQQTIVVCCCTIQQHIRSMNGEDQKRDENMKYQEADKRRCFSRTTGYK